MFAFGAKDKEERVFGIGETIKKFDAYSRPVRLHFKGYNAYRTPCGSLLTIMVVLIVFFFALIAVVDLIRPQPSVPVISKILYKSFYSIFKDKTGV